MNIIKLLRQNNNLFNNILVNIIGKNSKTKPTYIKFIQKWTINMKTYSIFTLALSDKLAFLNLK